MRKISWLGLILEFSPLLAFGFLAFLHRVGDPQKSPSLLIRILDYQGTYWIRNGIPCPPPLLVAGLLLCLFSWWRFRFPTAMVGTIVGAFLLGEKRPNRHRQARLDNQSHSEYVQPVSYAE